MVLYKEDHEMSREKRIEFTGPPHHLFPPFIPISLSWIPPINYFSAILPYNPFSSHTRSKYAAGIIC